MKDIVKAPETIHIHCILLSNFKKSGLVKRVYLKGIVTGSGKGTIVIVGAGKLLQFRELSEHKISKHLED